MPRDRQAFVVAAKMCSTCIFRPDNRMNLREGRVEEMVDTCVRANSHVTCHQSPRVEQGNDPDAEGWACRGFVERYPYVSIAQRIGEATGRIIEVDPRTGEDVT